MDNHTTRPVTTVVVPCYNEEKRLQPETFLSFVAAQENINILFVNDGSSDGTLSMLRDLANRATEHLRVLDLVENQGKAEAVRQGLIEAAESGADVVGYWDADLSTALSEIPRLLAPLANEPDVQVTLGSRIRMLGSDVRRQASRHYTGRVFATAASLVLGLPVYDTQCGAKLFRSSDVLLEALRDRFLSRWIFDVELIARLNRSYQRHRLDTSRCFVEVPLQAWADVPGSKLRLRDGLRAGFDLLSIRKRYPSSSGQAALTGVRDA